MSKHYSPEADDQMPEKKTSQNRLLLLLLLLVALFAYLYFFTGLIKPREEQVAQAPAPEAAPTDVVKQPLPPRPEAGAQPGAAGGEPATAPEGAKAGKPAADAKADQAPAQPETAPAKPGAPAAPASAPEGAKAGKSAAAAKGVQAGKPAAPQTAQKPAAPEAKPAAKPAATAKAAPGKPAAPAADAKKTNGKTAAAKDAKTAAAAKEAKTAAAAKEAKTAAAAKEAKTAAAAKEAKTAAAAKDAKTAAASKPAQGADGAAKKGLPGGKRTAAAKAAPAAAAGAYALEINDDLPQAEIKSVTAKLKQAGVSPVVTAKSQKDEAVHRLYLADFGDRQEALEELERLKLAAPNAFMLKENGRYAVYAGSFMREGRAAIEQDRLYEKGVKLLLKTGTATVPVVKLRAGSFASQAQAEKAAQGLKQKGIAAKVVKVAK